MTLTLDPRLEMRIQQKIEDGSHREASEVIDHALDLLDADESWSDAEKAQLWRRAWHKSSAARESTATKPEHCLLSVGASG
jgi:Arc/MetJ-type ribon-helix-helix transcriptional regulator